MNSRYQKQYKESIENPEIFWDKQAAQIEWFKKPTKILSQKNGGYTWFEDGVLNTCYLALDAHVAAGRGSQNAIVYDSPVSKRKREYTYSELLEKTSLFAGALTSKGVKKGDTVIIYMPMIPEAVIAMLACARIGAIHSVVFGGFAAHELAIRIDDAKPAAIITADYGIEVTKIIDYLSLVNEATQISDHKVETVIAHYRGTYTQRQDSFEDMEILMADATHCDCVPLKSTDPLYILYTSGTTGKPKGILRDNGGHAVALKWSMSNIYNARPGDVYWAASDIGWVVGHSYIVYAPLIQGCTSVLYEGKPVKTPDASAFWRAIEEYQVNTLFTAPTAIRAIRKEDGEASGLDNHDISSLKTLFLAGERCDPPTLEWARDILKKPVIDHWWQTETGWPIVANPMGIEPKAIKSGSSGIAVCGYDVQVLDEEGNQLKDNKEGAITIKLPLPPGCLTTLWHNDLRFHSSYLKEYPGYYKTGDGGYIDEDGYVFIMGRIDDVINVAGHRLSTGEMEEIISKHDAVAECAVFGIEDAIKGQIPCGLVVLKDRVSCLEHQLQSELVQLVRGDIGPIACLREVRIAKRLPKTRSGKTVRKILSAIRDNREYTIPSTIDNRDVLKEIENLYNYKNQQII